MEQTFVRAVNLNIFIDIWLFVCITCPECLLNTFTALQHVTTRGNNKFVAYLHCPMTQETRGWEHPWFGNSRTPIRHSTLHFYSCSFAHEMCFIIILSMRREKTVLPLEMGSQSSMPRNPKIFEQLIVHEH